ncbi:CCHC-type zinc finger transcription factor [Phycomyces blakesleeanus NRRL 1555(-)]|uniref:CCHC-type zinc finger transcription factor n=1 Tax=Phycomyces blakesleeanus (strain ATCC 8743b / DSM 1359 / FGSC 10004 / NBRC 33097 / NRRL 1555) TaxID=763407 RepID=A0A167R5J6_PHYB8|nr:CCHC-type zinc finger transcription factor [Phycomyces blakesleeanus NRRL 1555(-)]OAD80894.1 CCHC-type zinc finger transcription factor [Phycomyces blakesleeanus NRRL 1555(-)]|eukprot:XP_018298934.1 CCHC-type zinc finger transcription factor [Phycomyces blakesleeanus NRRL 1555(-)]
MALPAKTPPPLPRDPSPPPGSPTPSLNTPSTPTGSPPLSPSYVAAAVKSVDNSCTSRIIGSIAGNGAPRIWKEDSSPFSVFYEVPAEGNPLRPLFFEALNTAFPLGVGRGLTYASRTSRTSFEFHLVDQEACSRACQVGFPFNGRTVFASPAIPSTFKLLRLRVSRLPLHGYADFDELAENLRRCLAIYGQVQEISLNLKYNYPDGTGTIHMLCPPNPDLHLRHLEHEIKYNETTTFLATWARMGTHCTFCKEMGHEKEACTKRPKETRTCFRCGKVGHLAHQCPRNEEAESKRPRKTARSPTHAPAPPAAQMYHGLLPSETIYGSQHAPQNIPLPPLATESLSRPRAAPGAIPGVLPANHPDFLIEAAASTGMDDNVQLVKTSDGELGNEETKKSDDEEYYSDDDIDEIAKYFAQMEDDPMDGENDGGQDPPNPALTL